MLWREDELKWPQLLWTTAHALRSDVDPGGELRSRLLGRHSDETEARRADQSFKRCSQSAMTPERFKLRMREVSTLADGERKMVHWLADDLLCEMLIQLGYGDGVVMFKSLVRRYA